MHYRAGKDWFKQTLLPSGVGRYTVGNSSKIEKTERNEQNEMRLSQIRREKICGPRQLKQLRR